MSRWLTGEDYAAMFSAFESSAFRLETRQRYDAEDERAAFGQFLAGEPLDLDWLHPWLATVRTMTRAGRRMLRVRLISDPPSDYLRFGLALTPYLEGAGHDVLYLDERRAVSLGLPSHDYWLFDDRVLVILHFTPEDQFQAAELVEEPALVVAHTAAARTAVEHARPRSASAMNTASERRASQ